MAYTAALLFGQGLSEESGVADMIERYFYPKTPPTSAKTMPMKSVTARRGSVTARRGSVESYEDTDNQPLCAAFDTSLEDEERLLQLGVVRQLELCLTAAKSSALKCRALLLPRQMTSRVSQDMLSSSVGEPCGLRGACISLYVESEDGLRSLGGFSPDPGVTPTFELSVVFRVDASGWTLRHFFTKGSVVTLRPEYRLIKRKLYSSASPVIRHFN